MQKFYVLLLICVFIGSSCSTGNNHENESRPVQQHSNDSRIIEISGSAAMVEQTPDTSHAPQLVKAVAPIMPREAVRRRIEGKVQAKLIIDATGQVKSVEILSSPHRILSEAVIQAMSQWVFTPLLVNGMPSAFTVRQTYSFSAK